MPGPFDDQLILDCTESLAYVAPDGSTATVAAATVDDQGVQTVQVGYLNLIARDALITVGRTQQPTRPVEGGRYTDGDGTVWQIVGVLKRTLGNFWEVTGRTFAVPGGLIERWIFERRDSSLSTAEGLNSPTWPTLELNVVGKLIPDAQEIDAAGETAVDTVIRGKLLLAGYREIRAGDRGTKDGGVTLWTVDSAEPYDVSLGVQFLSVTRIV